MLFRSMSDLAISKAGTITSDEAWFMEWKTKDGSYENTQYAQFDTFLEGMFDKERLLDRGCGRNPGHILKGESPCTQEKIE